MNVYDIVTEKMIERLQAGVIPWRKPWKTTSAKNLVSKKAYRGINAWLLALSEYKSPYWLTYKQCSNLGGNVKKGSKSTLVTFWKINKAEEGTADKKSYVILRYYNVFNVEQCEGLTLPEESKLEFVPIEKCEQVVREMPNAPQIDHKGNKACYTPALDTVTMPHRETFLSVEKYYSTLFHELTHSTGHASRLFRKGIADTISFGSETYSREELIAEMGAAYLSNICGIDLAVKDNSASYLQGWIDRLKGDTSLIVSAASQAQKATDYILGTTPEENTSEE